MSDAIAKGVSAAMAPIMQQIATAMAPRPVAPTPEAIDDVSNDDLDTAINEGKGSTAIRRAAKAEVTRAVQAAIAQVAPRLTALETDGMSSMGKLATTVALSNLPYYGDYKAEIDSIIEQSGSVHRGDPENLKRIYAMVVGAHLPEIEARLKEKTLRELREDPTSGAALAGQGSRATETKDEEPDVVAIFGEQAARALEVNGLTLDGFARKLGYANAKDYIEKTNIGGHA